jgi:hypothetical protein
MPRSISVYRRRANLIDMNWPSRVNVQSYILKAATNFDGVFSSFANVSANGFRSKSVVDYSFTSEQFRGKTRIMFNPTDFSLSDTQPIWIRIAAVATGGVIGSDETIHLILPYQPPANRMFILSGTAPSAVSIANSLELQLPQQCKNVIIQVNDAANDLYVAFEPNGTEFRVPTLKSDYTNFQSVYASVSQLFIRGNGGTSLFNLSAEIRDNSLSY